MRGILEGISGLGAVTMFIGALFMTPMGVLGRYAWSRRGGTGLPSLRDVIDVAIGDPTEASFVFMALLLKPGLWAMAGGLSVAVLFDLLATLDI